MTSRSAVQTAEAPQAIGPYSQAIRAAGLVFCAGQVGIDPKSGELVEGGVTAEAEQAMTNVASLLAAAGSSLEQVVKTTIFLAEMSDFAAVNEIYARHMAQPYPARSTVAVKALPRGAQVEIECLALDPGPS